VPESDSKWIELKKISLLLQLKTGKLQMDFSAKKEAKIDEKGRVVLPADFKNLMGGRIPGGQLAVEVDPHVKCLNIYPLENWEKHLASVKSGLNLNDREQRYLLDIFYSNFKIIPVPDSGRMNLPNDFVEEVNIAKEVVFVGRGSCIGLWDIEAYKAYIGPKPKATYGDLWQKYLGGIRSGS